MLECFDFINGRDVLFYASKYRGAERSHHEGLEPLYYRWWKFMGAIDKLSGRRARPHVLCEIVVTNKGRGNFWINSTDHP